jgi:hypothetical protein
MAPAGVSLDDPDRIKSFLQCIKGLKVSSNTGPPKTLGSGASLPQQSLDHQEIDSERTAGMAGSDKTSLAEPDVSNVSNTFARLETIKEETPDVFGDAIVRNMGKSDGVTSLKKIGPESSARALPMPADPTTVVPGGDSRRAWTPTQIKLLAGQANSTNYMESVLATFRSTHVGDTVEEHLTGKHSHSSIIHGLTSA